ncbi:hypothetical protein [Streptomyces sp. 6-11-2]|uniref:hypothetical protein n=1 Tax=Streptomyces sp. 6-11-2 TaxID=2585753 RepID=UPI0035A5DCD0
MPHRAKPSRPVPRGPAWDACEASFPSVRLTEETILDLAPLDMAERMSMVPGAAGSAGHPVRGPALRLAHAR